MRPRRREEREDDAKGRGRMLVWVLRMTSRDFAALRSHSDPRAGYVCRVPNAGRVRWVAIPGACNEVGSASADAGCRPRTDASAEADPTYYAGLFGGSPS